MSLEKSQRTPALAEWQHAGTLKAQSCNMVISLLILSPHTPRLFTTQTSMVQSETKLSLGVIS